MIRPVLVYVLRNKTIFPLTDVDRFEIYFNFLRHSLR